ncbi:hypothetical protein ACUXST_002175 [Sphingomonas sp. F9_3S_D5_B_2]
MVDCVGHPELVSGSVSAPATALTGWMLKQVQHGGSVARRPGLSYSPTDVHGCGATLATERRNTSCLHQVAQDLLVSENIGNIRGISR